MSPFGWGILFGGFGTAFVLGLAHVGKGWLAVLVTVIWAVVLAIIPNHWVGMRKKLIPPPISDGAVERLRQNIEARYKGPREKPHIFEGERK